MYIHVHASPWQSNRDFFLLSNLHDHKQKRLMDLVNGPKNMAPVLPVLIEE